jgi:hypothetical protein
LDSAALFVEALLSVYVSFRDPHLLPTHIPADLVVGLRRGANVWIGIRLEKVACFVLESLQIAESSEQQRH